MSRPPALQAVCSSKSTLLPIRTVLIIQAQLIKNHILDPNHRILYLLMEYRSPSSRPKIFSFLILVGVLGLMGQAFGQRCDQRNCQVCDQNDSNKCVLCNAEYALYQSACYPCSYQCAKCQIVKPSNSASIKNQCLECKTRTYMDSSNTCSMCDYSCATCTSFTSCTSCSNGYTLDNGNCSYNNKSSGNSLFIIVPSIVFFVVIFLCIWLCAKAKKKNRPLVVGTGYSSADQSVPSSSPYYNTTSPNPIYSQPAFGQPAQPVFGVSPPGQAPYYQQPPTSGMMPAQGIAPPPMDNLDMAKPNGPQNTNYPNV